MASGSRNRGPSGGWQDHPDRRRRSGPAGASSGSVKTRKPGLLRAQTSLPIFFPLLEKAQSIQRKRDDFRGFLLVSLALGSPGSQSTKGPLGSGSPEKGPGSLPDCSTYQRSFLFCVAHRLCTCAITSSARDALLRLCVSGSWIVRVSLSKCFRHISCRELAKSGESSRESGCLGGPTGPRRGRRWWFPVAAQACSGLTVISDMLDMQPWLRRRSLNLPVSEGPCDLISPRFCFSLVALLATADSPWSNLLYSKTKDRIVS